MAVSSDPLVGFVDTLGAVLGGMFLERHVDERDERTAPDDREEF